MKDAASTSKQGERPPENFAQLWRRIGPKLEQVRRAELRAFKHEEHIEAIDALLQIGYLHGKPRNTSGLVILQRILARARQ
jgi:hypothetical protein